ncbi:MAG: tetratricopeptide repeat protein [Gammaproteobacteria bacterium]|nr:tetratricopeptide repeat protein [Gammaproteobacteria bacterium]
MAALIQNYRVSLKRPVYGVFLVIVLSVLAGCGSPEDRQARYFAHGQDFYQEGNFEKARVEFRNVLQIDPHNVEARMALARSLLGLQNWQDGARQLLAVLHEDAAHVGANFELGQLYLRARNIESARKHAEAILTVDANNPDGMTLLAGVLLAEGDAKGADEAIAKVLALSPWHKHATALEARLLVSRGDYSAAAQIVRHWLAQSPGDIEMRAVLVSILDEAGDIDSAIVEMAEVVALADDSLPYRLNLARYLLEHTRLDAAESVLREAATGFPDDSDSKIMLAEIVARKSGRPAAIALLRSMLSRNEGDYRLQFELGRLLVSESLWAEARTVYDDAIRRAGDKSPLANSARTRLAAVAARQGNLDEANNIITTVLQNNPRDKEGLTLRGTLALTRGDAAAAIADFRSVQREDAGDVNVRRMLVRAHLANHEPELAIDQLRKGIEQDPAATVLRAELADVYLRTNNVEGATDQLNDILRVEPANLDALKSLFQIDAARKDWFRALTDAQRIQQQFPDDSLGWHFAGIAYQAMHKPDDSISAFVTALEKAPDAIQPLTLLVRAYLSNQQQQRAFELVQTTLNSNNRNFVAANLLGELQLGVGDYEAARKAFELAMTANPRWDIPYRNLAATYLVLGDSAAVSKTLESGIAATKGSALLITTYANQMAEFGQLDKAIEKYSEILAANPDSELATNNLAMLLAEYRYDDPPSMARAKELVASLAGSDNPGYQDTVGWVYYRAGNFAEAVEYLQRAANAMSDSAVIRYHLGMALLAEGNKLSASSHLQFAVDAGVNFRGLETARARLTELAGI